MNFSIYQAKHYFDRLLLKGLITRSTLQRETPVL
ncbi:hypothetical protein AAZ33_19610 [Edwardsiella sp. LADL05-105]|nr:hypothetical protein AAZ33_19610 [Edwardsiella sp. LADL05-105]